MTVKLCIIDYGMGNLRSIANAVEFLGGRIEMASKPTEIPDDAALILPGVGAFGLAMMRLRQSGLAGALQQHVASLQKPLLGICLGMQLLADGSDETPGVEGLGLVDAHVERLPDLPLVAVPHVGWNTVSTPPESLLFSNIRADSHFYFDHSFHVVTKKTGLFGHTDFGSKTILASFEQGNIMAAQFHPERSQTAGLRLLRNYLNFAASWRARC
jgi:glutamine amidotransferase